MTIQTFNERMIWEGFPQVFLSLVSLSPPWSDETQNRRQQLRQPVNREPFTRLFCWRQFFVAFDHREEVARKKVESCLCVAEVEVCSVPASSLISRRGVSPLCLLYLAALASLVDTNFVARNSSPSPQRETLKWMSLRAAEGLVHRRVLAAGLLGSERSTAGPCWRSWGRQSIGSAGMTGTSAGLPLCQAQQTVLSWQADWWVSCLLLYSWGYTRNCVLGSFLQWCSDVL